MIHCNSYFLLYINIRQHAFQSHPKNEYIIWSNLKHFWMQCVFNKSKKMVVKGWKTLSGWVLNVPLSWHIDVSWDAMLSVADAKLRLEMATLSRKSMRSLSATRCCISSDSFSCLSRSSSKRCEAVCLCSESLSATALSKASRHVRSSVSIADRVSDTVHDFVLSRDVSC
jgi:hypothetical protein